MFDSNRPLGTVQNTRMCINTNIAEVILAPESNRAIAASGSAGAGTVIAYSNSAFVNQPTQVRTLLLPLLTLAIAH